MESNGKNLVCLTDYEKKAKAMVDMNTRDYWSTGADKEQTLSENVTDFRQLRFRPRMMVDVSDIKLYTTILGERIEFPVCVAPTGLQKLAHCTGEIGTAKAAERMGTCVCISTGTNYSVDQISQAAQKALKWFQLYVCKDRVLSEKLVGKAERAGFKAIVVTVDTPEAGKRRASHRNKFGRPAHIRYGNFDGLTEFKGDQHKMIKCLPMNDNTLTWKDVAWLTTITKLPVIAKGILTGYDAEKALEAGCSAIYVSNHGGRQLDGVSSTIMALEEVVRAVDGRAEVFMDSGVRTGTDVLKALSLGARAVFIGRPILWGLAVGGEEGAMSILEILKKELKLAMQLTGVTDAERVPRDIVMNNIAKSRL